MTVKLPGYPEISPNALELLAVIRDTIVDIQSTESKLAKYFKLLIFTFLTSLVSRLGSMARTIVIFSSSRLFSHASRVLSDTFSTPYTSTACRPIIS